MTRVINQLTDLKHLRHRLKIWVCLKVIAKPFHPLIHHFAYERAIATIFYGQTTISKRKTNQKPPIPRGLYHPCMEILARGVLLFQRVG